jgi:hypothetical protein
VRELVRRGLLQAIQLSGRIRILPESVAECERGLLGLRRSPGQRRARAEAACHACDALAAPLRTHVKEDHAQCYRLNCHGCGDLRQAQNRTFAKKAIPRPPSADSFCHAEVK